MQSFISETLNRILQKQTSFKNTFIVLPSQRAGIFVKEALKEKIERGFLPEIITIEQLIQKVSGITKIDTVQLLFHFYSVYKKLEEEPEEFDSFASWAFTAIQDFNEIDQHLVNSKEIFAYLRDIQRLKEWTVNNSIDETKLIKSHFSFLEKLGVYYTEFYNYLLEKNIGYQGLMYREAAKKINDYCSINTSRNFIFIGFNALNKAEEFLFQEMLAHGKTTIYWDIDHSFLKGNHQAGTFIRKYKSAWKYYHSNPIHTVSTNFNSKKNIEVIGASKNSTQIKYAGEILNTLPSFNNTAFVLADESLLPITLNSLPQKVDAINITMGYPLKDLPTTSLFNAIFQLFLTQEKLQKSAVQQFYYKDLIRFFKHASIQRLLIVDGHNLFDKISLKISQDNDSFISLKQIKSFLNPLEETFKNCLITLFSPFETSLAFIERIIALIDQLKTTTNTLEKEYLYRFYTAFTQLQNLQLEYSYLKNLKIIYHFFNQLIAVENISFQGEPLQGLQLMGMLETRVLDFENVIITSVNENILPSNSIQSSFIPFDVKTDFGLPTYKEKDAIFSYHFFRLLQRAKNIFLLYNTENDAFGGGEKSRFLTQLLHTQKHIKEQHISPPVITEQNQPKEIAKDPSILNLLKEVAQKGFSPSTLTNYLYNPLDFYKQKILKLKEYKEVEETVAYNTMGTIIHDILETLYKPFEGHFITVKELHEMTTKVDDLTVYYFKKHFHSSDVFTGKNRLIFEVTKNYVVRFLQMEKELLSGQNTLKIIATEQSLEATIAFEELNFPIKIRGQVDRIDELNGITRIIDYKSGHVTKTDLKISDLKIISEEKFSKAIQVLLYAFLYTQKHPTNKSIEGGIISFKNLKSGFLKLNFAEKRGEDYEITEEKITVFMETIKELILEIFNPEIPFIEKVH